MESKIEKDDYAKVRYGGLELELGELLAVKILLVKSLPMYL